MSFYNGDKVWVLTPNPTKAKVVSATCGRTRYKLKVDGRRHHEWWLSDDVHRTREDARRAKREVS